MVRIRLTRTGRRNKAYWRIAAFEQHKSRDSEPIEYLGSYDPHQGEDEEKVTVDRERVEHWLSVGAQPSESVAQLLRSVGIAV